ncbi:Uma2 family endonuclease [Alienimonas californiensis]|uniref:Uma2 family endonuclease n=1 Tax=Alienimonas californiensis TaxID=2527989 RepID=UPI0013FD0F76|nr:Uma2 family endonuclease [Alienimonas californiensis]
MADAARRPFTVAELAERFGSLPAWRVRTKPYPGTATREDAERLRDAGDLCELVDGTLIEKTVSYVTSVIAIRVAWLLMDFVERHDLGWVGGSDGYVDLYGGTLQRAPDVSLVLDEQYPDGLPRRGYVEGAPALCVEVVSPDNTRPEMARKRREYFENGCRLCWTIYPATDDGPATCEVHTPLTDDGGTGPEDGAGTVLTEADDLTGGAVLPGFAVPFAKALRRGA